MYIEFFFVTDLPEPTAKKGAKSSSVKKKFSKNVKKSFEDSVSY